MSWHVYLGGAEAGDVKKLKPPEECDSAAAEKQFAMARRFATQIINAGLAGDPKKVRFDVSLSGHANKGHKPSDRERPDSVKVSVSQDHVSIPPPEG